MELSQDYESSSEGESTISELPKPVYLRSRRRHLRVNKPDVKHSPKRQSATNFSKLPKPLVYERVETKPKPTPRNSIPCSSSNPVQEHLFEYGEPINGYKFITTPSNLQLIRTHQSTNAPAQESSYLQDYWNLVDLKLPPVDPGNQMNRDNVYFFYQKSCNLLKQDMKKIIKGERIRWHPDRMHLPEATRIFQIINDIWESLKEV